MKKFTRFLCLTLVALLSLCMLACDPDTPQEPADPTPPPSGGTVYTVTEEQWKAQILATATANNYYGESNAYAIANPASSSNAMKAWVDGNKQKTTSSLMPGATVYYELAADVVTEYVVDDATGAVAVETYGAESPEYQAMQSSSSSFIYFSFAKDAYAQATYDETAKTYTVTNVSGSFTVAFLQLNVTNGTFAFSFEDGVLKTATCSMDYTNQYTGEVGTMHVDLTATFGGVTVTLPTVPAAQ